LPPGGAPEALVLDGEAGIGKTTLFEAALAEGKDQRSLAFGRRSYSAQSCCMSEREPTEPNGCTKSTSWGSLVRAQYRPSKEAPLRRGFL